MAQQLNRAQVRFQSIRRDARQRAILQAQIGPILQVNPRLTEKQAKQIYDRAQQFKKA